MHMVNIGAADKDGQIDLTKEEKTNFRLYFDEKEPLTPYVNVAEAFRYYIDDVENLISSDAADNRSYQITLANKNKDEFQFVIDTQIKAIQVSGNLAKVSKDVPFYAQHSGFAKIIGVKPSGGECVLSTDRLPNGQSYAHSGTLRVCYPSGKKYVYDESGVKIDTDISYEDFYNLEAIVKELKEAEQEAAENPGD